MSELEIFGEGRLLTFEVSWHHGWMDFDFDSDDDAQYQMAADTFLDAFDEWAVDHLGDDAGDRRADAAMFLDWNRNHRGKGLDNLSRSDLDDFLLAWLPSKYIGSSDEAPAIVHAVQSVVEFLVAHNELDGGAERAASLIPHTYDIADAVVQAMDDPAKFGLGKSVLGAQLDDSNEMRDATLADLSALLGEPHDASDESKADLSTLLGDSELTIEELQPLLEAQMNAFNDLPFEERKRLTDPAFGAKRQIALPFTFVPPHPTEVEASASTSDVVRMVDGFVKHAAEHGIALTNRGNIKLADARELAAELATGEDAGKITSSLDLRWLTLVDDLATACGAVERLSTKIRSDAKWFDLSATEKASRLAAMVLHGGFLSSHVAAASWLHEQRELLDDGVPHWFSVGLVEGAALLVEEIMSHALDVAAMRQHDRRTSTGADTFDQFVVVAVGELFDGLERFGLVSWLDREQAEHAASGTEYGVGGTIELTPLGRHVFPDLVREAGYTFDEVEGIEDASAQQMVDIAMAAGLTGADVLARWRTDLDITSRLHLVADCVIEGRTPERLIGFEIFAAVGDPAVVAPIVGQLLDSPAGSYAATYLLEHGLASHGDVGAFIDLTPIIDMLCVRTGDPEVFDEIFQSANEKIDGDFIDELWRHDLPEVAWVLDAAGKHVTDKALAKAARKAVIQHRSMLANQGR